MNYSLYKVEIIRDVPMMFFIMSMMARNIIEAEDRFEGSMDIGPSYMILINK